MWLTTADETPKARSAARPALLAAGASGDEAVTIDTVEAFPARSHGFGAAMTDASAQLFSGLPEDKRKAIMAELFGRGPDGLGLSFTRLTVGASDFSPDPLQLRRHARQCARSGAHVTSRSTTPRQYVLPRTREALAINPELKVMISPWSAPAWMKTTKKPDQGPARAAILPGLRQLSRAYGRGIRARRRAGDDAYHPERARLRAGESIRACG